MERKLRYQPFLLFIIILISACSPISTPDGLLYSGEMSFSGENAFEIEKEYVSEFPNRHSGQENNRLAAEWFYNRLSKAGWNCGFDEWEIVNYSEPVELINTICKLPGLSSREILIAAHHDQAPTTIEGADNDASGISILVHLAEIFASESPHAYTLAFVSTDAEEYGMIGSGRYIQTHTDPEQIIAGISLDNLGRDYYDGMNMELIGQYRNYGPIWLAIAAHDAAEGANSEWEVHLRAPIDQILDQAGPISFMDQGPMVAAGVPALGFTGKVPEKHADEQYHLWHDPDDTITHQSAESLGEAGLITEALVRYLFSLESFPAGNDPYLYFDESQEILKGAPLMIIFIAFVSIYFLGSFIVGGKNLREMLKGWRIVWPHFAGLWIPLFGSVLLLYLFVGIGLMENYDTYPATTKDPNLLNPNWFAISLYLIGTALLFVTSRKAARKYSGEMSVPIDRQKRSFALFILGLCSLYVLSLNPFSLLFVAPTLFWFLIRGRKNLSLLIDVILYLLGGLVFYGLFYFFGFVTLRYNFAFLWFLMNMFSIQMISPYTSAVIAAILAAGLSLIVREPRKIIQ